MLRALRAEGPGYKSSMLLFMLGHAWETMGAGVDARAVVVQTLVSAWVKRERLTLEA